MSAAGRAMRDWSTTVPGIRFRATVLAVLTHEQFRAMVRDLGALVAWCQCGWLGVGTPRHGRSALCERVWAGPAAPFPGRLQLPDLARDARIERRRAADRAAASRALDDLLAPWRGVDLRPTHYGREMRCVASVDMHVDPHTCGYRE